MRWSNLDKKLIKTQPIIKGIYQEIIDECVDSFNLLGGFDEINNQITQKDKRMLNKALKSVKDVRFLPINVFKTKRDILFLLCYIAFFGKNEEILDCAFGIFRNVSNESIDLISKDAKKKFEHLKQEKLDEIALVPLLFLPFEEYLSILHLSECERIYKAIQNYVFDEKTEVEKLTKALISTKDSKFSGVIHDTAINVANKSYVLPLEDDSKVIFRAVVDDRTTDMCLSLDEQIFYVDKENTFKRYYASKGGEEETTVKGLVSGINLPPITDHLHHCRSFVEYVK